MAAASMLFLSAAETLTVPVMWQNPKSKIQAIGVLIQPERYVFAFKIPELKN